MKRNLHWLFLAAAFLCALTSLVLIDRFPPVNADEIGTAGAAYGFLKTGEISFPFQQQAGHPYFRLFSASTPDSLRGVYIRMLALIERVSQINFKALRLFSFFIWLAAGVLLFRLVRTHAGLPSAQLSALLWLTWLDSTLAAHLIRPDALLGCLFIFSLGLVASPEVKPFRAYATVGFLSGVGAAIHPHTLLIAGVAFIVWVFYQRRLIRPAGDAPLGLALGFFAGILIAFLCADMPGFFINRYTMVMDIIRNLTSDWTDRLRIYNLLGDALGFILRPQTFYIPTELRLAPFWPREGFCRFLLYLSVVLFWWTRSDRPAFVRFLLIAATATFLGLGFGVIRTEFIYQIPLSLVMIPLACLILVNLPETVRSNFLILAERLGQTHARLLLAALIVFVGVYFWIGAVLPLVFFGGLFLCLLCTGLSDRAILGGAGGVLVGLFLLIIRDPNILKSWTTVPAPALLYGGLFLGGAAFGVLLYFARNRDAGRQIGTLLLVTVIALSTVFLSASGVAHKLTLGIKTPSLNTSYAAIETITENEPGRVLGPACFWFYYPERFQSTGAVLFDYYYTGQKRPWDPILRYRPRILIVDAEFKGRFLTVPVPGGRAIIPMERIIPAPFKFLGQVPATAHHPALEIYRLDWPLPDSV